MTLTDVKIRVPEDRASYIIPNNRKAELVRNAMVLYPYINNLTISHGKAAEILGIRKYDHCSLRKQVLGNLEENQYLEKSKISRAMYFKTNPDMVTVNEKWRW